MRISTEQFEKGLEAFHALVQGDPALHAEFEESIAGFFSEPGLLGEEGPSSEAARRRHLEWFLFEKVSTFLGGLPVEILLARWRERVDEELHEHLEAFLQSQAGIFEVTTGEADAGTWLCDVAGLGEYPLDEPEMAAIVSPGDLIVGRIYPVGDALHRVSAGAGFFRDPRLREAIQRDLDRVRGSRPHPLIRLSQAELERMFWGPSTETPAASDPVGELKSFLESGGVESATVKSWCRLLARTPFDQETIASVVVDPLAGMLDAIAFDTKLDLETARVLFLAAWSRLAEKGRAPATDSSRGEADIARAIAEFDADRARGVDVEASFRELERRLGIDEDDEDEECDAPDFPGVVAAMIEEFLWETERESGPDAAARHEGLRIFGGYTKELGVFENLGPREFLTFAAFWLPESRRLRSGAEAERMVRALALFGRWAERTQGLESLDQTLVGQLEGLRESLPRVVVANALLPVDREHPGELFEFVKGPGAGRARLRDREGEEREVSLEDRLVALLRDGDLLRGYTRDDGAFVVGCCYPPEAIALKPMES